MARSAVEPAASASIRPDVFLSYSRRDKDWVEMQLASALEAAGKDVWIDVDDIRGGVSDWRATIWAGIEASKAVVFVLTPDSLASRVCSEELVHATALNKRIIPVLRRPVDDISVPDALERPNWIYARDSDDFHTAAATLVTALETDEQWIDAHARLTQRTAEWLRMDRDHSYLLRGHDLRAAERWLDDQGAHAESATADQVAYINAARRASQRRQALLLGGVVVALGVSIVLGVIAYIQRQTARSQSFAAQAIDATNRDPEEALKLALDAAALRQGPLVARALRTAIAAAGWQHILRSETARPVNDVTFSPEGRLAVIGADDGAASVWDVRSGRRTASLLGHGGAINSVEFSPDGRRILTAARDGTARIWDRKGRSVRTLRVAKKREDVWSAAFDNSGERVIVGTAQGAAQVWKLAGHGSAVHLPGAGEHRLVFTRFSPDGRRALTPGTGGSVQIWRISPRALVARLRPDRNAGRGVTVAEFSPDGRRILAGYDSGAVCIWVLRAARGRARSCFRQDGFIRDAAFSPDGTRFVSASDRGTVVIRTTAGPRRRIALPRGGPLHAVSFSDDGGHVLTAGEDRRVRIWTTQGHLEHMLVGHTDAVVKARFSPRGARVLTGSADGSARIWATSQGEIALRGPPLRDAHVAFSPNGRRLLAVDQQGAAAVWDLHSRTPTKLDRGMVAPADRTPACGRPTGCAPWSADSRYVAGSDQGYQGAIWDARTGSRRQLTTLAFDAAFLPDMTGVIVLGDAGATVVNPASESTCARRAIGQLIEGARFTAKLCARLPTGTAIDGIYFTADRRILTSAEGRVQLWGRTGNSVGPSLARGAQAVAITPDGQRLAIGTRDELEIYDLRRGSRRVASALQRDIADVTFDGSGERILAVSSDRTARVWRSDNLKRPVAVLRHTSAILGAEFSPGGRFVLTVSDDGKARLWDPRLETTLLSIRMSPHGGARFSPNGRFVAVGGPDAVELHRCEVCAPFGTLVRVARSRLPSG